MQNYSLRQLNISKEKYRNKKLLDFAETLTECTLCGGWSDAIVAAHSNQLRDGKAKGTKAHDFRIAYLCPKCHFDLDQGSKLSYEERIEKWESAHRITIGLLFLSGKLEIK